MIEMLSYREALVITRRPRRLLALGTALLVLALGFAGPATAEPPLPATGEAHFKWMKFGCLPDE